MYNSYNYNDPYVQTPYEPNSGLKRSRGNSEFEAKSSRRRSASEADNSYCYLEQFNDSVSDSPTLSSSLFSLITSNWKRRHETRNTAVVPTTNLPKISYIHFNGASIVCSTQDNIDYFVNQLLYRDSHLDGIDYDSFETKEFILESLANAKLSEKALVEDGSLNSTDNYYQGNISHQSLVIMDLRTHKVPQARNSTMEDSVKECVSKTGTWKYMSVGLGNLLSLRKNFEELKKESQQLGQGNKSSSLAELTKNSGWLKQLCEILHCVDLALRILRPKEDNGVRQPSTILLHCNENIKRVRQISLLVKVCSNSYYRTRKGFVELLEKEFCLKKSNHNSLFQEGYSDSSPIILQTLDCTRIFIEQFPTMFEFTSDFLVAFYSLIRKTKPMSPRLSPRTKEMSKCVMEDVAFKSLAFEQDVQEIPAFLYRLHVEVRLWGAYFQLRSKIWALNDDAARLRSSWDQRVESSVGTFETEDDLVSSR